MVREGACILLPFRRIALLLDLSEYALRLVILAVRTSRHLAVAFDLLLPAHVAGLECDISSCSPSHPTSQVPYSRNSSSLWVSMVCPIIQPVAAEVVAEHSRRDCVRRYRRSIDGIAAKHAARIIVERRGSKVIDPAWVRDGRLHVIHGCDRHVASPAGANVESFSLLYVPRCIRTAGYRGFASGSYQQGLARENV